MNHLTRLSATSFFAIALLTGSSTAISAQDLASELRAATSELATTAYDLKYKFKEGEVVRYEVEHLVTVDTKMAGNTQQTKSTTGSTKSFEVTTASDDKIEFVHQVEDVKMWQQSDGREAVEYDSKSGKEPPADFKVVAERIGKPIATVMINRSGQVIKRDKASADLGFGGIVVPLPSKPVKLKQAWTVPKSFRLKEKDGRTKLVKTQLKYRLEKVQTGVATISVKTEVLTPINDATLKSQLVQQISNGEIKFDIDAGRVISKQLDWTENVIGFNGADSNMKYLARFTENLIDTRTAKRDSITK